MSTQSETGAARAGTEIASDAACAWCGTRLRVKGSSGTLLCASCGAETTWPVPTETQLDRAYGSWYRPARGRFAGLGDRALRGLRGRTARRLDRIAPPGPVLDVGAGDGALLDALSGLGRPATGLERHSTRGDVREGELSGVEGGWAAIVFWHSLEHLREPGAALEEAARLLERDGVLLVAMPNLASLQALAFGDRWFAMDMPRHLVHVPAPALLSRIRSLGMRPTRVSHWRGGQVVFGWLHGLVGSLPSHPDLYDAIRRPEARRNALSRRRRTLTLALATLALPLAALCAALEVLLRRGGTVYVEARRA